MPLLFKQNIENAVLAFWSITESEDELARLVTGEDRLSARRFSNRDRRMQHLAWRAALRAIAPDTEISYLPDGETPYVDGADTYVSAAHTDGAAVAMLSPGRCAVDVENVNRDFNRAAPRFVSERERQLPASGDPRFLPAMWCAKEAMYKYAGVAGLDFLTGMTVASIDLDKGSAEGVIEGMEGVRIGFLRSGDFIVAYII